jgi:hypothetical protein
MGFLRQRSGQKQTYSSIPVQESVATLPIQVCYGYPAVAGNLIQYTDFKKGKASAKGKGFASKDASDDYSATVIMALGESGAEAAWSTIIAPVYCSITAVDRVFVNQGVESLSVLGFGLITGAINQAPWSYMLANHPDEALAYPGICYVCQSNYDLGPSPMLPQCRFVVRGGLYGTAVDTVNADPTLMVVDIITNPQYGVAPQVGNTEIDWTTINTGAGCVTNYIKALGLGLSAVFDSIERANAVLTRLLQFMNVAAFFSGASLKFIPMGTDAITANGVTFTPNLTAAYNLTDDDFIYTEGEDPV